MPYRLCSALLAFALLPAACNKSSSSAKPAPDLSSPKSALRTYGEAMRNGDAATARQAVTGIDPRAVELLANLGASRRELDDAAVSRFGEEGRSIAGGGEVPYGEAFQKMLEAADVKIDGDTATVTEKHSETSATAPAGRPPSPIPLKLRKIGGSWKLDYGAMDNTRDLADSIPMMQLLLKSNSELATEIKAGKYESLSQAREARLNKLRQLLSHNPGVPNSVAPATR